MFEIISIIAEHMFLQIYAAWQFTGLSSYSDFAETSFKSKPMNNNYFQTQCQMFNSNNLAPCLVVIENITMSNKI